MKKQLLKLMEKQGIRTLQKNLWTAFQFFQDEPVKDHPDNNPKDNRQLFEIFTQAFLHQQKLLIHVYHCS